MTSVLTAEPRVRTAEQRPEARRRWLGVPILLVLAAVAFNLWTLRAEVLPAQNLNDSAVHLAMVDWAEARIEGGHLSLDGWFPNLGLGASRFHHYQSLPHILTGYLAVILGSQMAFSLSLYLLLALWPLCIYASARLFEFERWPAALAALISPLLVADPGLGYQYGSYTWQGWGTWAQLWAMWLLPLAWALSWRAIARRGSIALAALVVALTMATHFLTGYLALLTIGVWVLLKPSDLRRRLGRGALVGVGALLVASWAIVPLLADRAYAIQSEFSRNTFYYDSFGARRVLGWLFTGRTFDAGRLPVVSLLVALGVGVSVWRFRRDERGRALLLAGGLSLLLFFGRPTLGPLLRLLPGSDDMFLNRYIMGVHLAGIFLAGLGMHWATRRMSGVARWLLPRWRPVAVAAAIAVLGAAFVAPAFAERASYNARGARWIHQQRQQDETDGRDAAGLIERAKAMGGGRIYAGLATNWGTSYTVGFAPVYTMLLTHGADGVGFTRPTSSLSAGIEARFEDRNPAHYELLGVRYLLLPGDREPPVAASLLERRGRHALWMVSTSGYLDAVDTVGPIEADRTNLGERMEAFLRSDLPSRGLYPTVAYGGREAAPATAGLDGILEDRGGRVVRQQAAPADGEFAGTVASDRPVMVLLRSSFDPRWRVEVDGVEVPPQMVAPSFVGRIVPPGEHSISFSYISYPFYQFLLGLGALTLLGLHLAQRSGRRLARRRPAART